MKIIGDSDEGIANEGSTSDEVAKHQTKDSIDMFAHKHLTGPFIIMGHNLEQLELVASCFKPKFVHISMFL